MAEVTTREFVSTSQTAVLDPQLRQAFGRAGTGFDGARREAIEEITPGTVGTMASTARSIKEHTINHLDYYLEMLERNVRLAGGQVHFATDADRPMPSSLKSCASEA